MLKKLRHRYQRWLFRRAFKRVLKYGSIVNVNFKNHVATTTKLPDGWKTPTGEDFIRLQKLKKL